MWAAEKWSSGNFQKFALSYLLSSLFQAKVKDCYSVRFTVQLLPTQKQVHALPRKEGVNRWISVLLNIHSGYSHLY